MEYFLAQAGCEGDQKPLKDISPREKHIKELGKRGPVQGEVAVLNKLLAGYSTYRRREHTMPKVPQVIRTCHNWNYIESVKLFG